MNAPADKAFLASRYNNRELVPDHGEYFERWAEASAREGAGASIRLDPALWPAAGDAQEERRAADPWEAILEPLLDGDGIVTPDFVAAADVWAALKLEANHLDNRHADRVTAILQRHGFTFKGRKSIDGRQRRGWGKQPEGAR